MRFLGRAASVMPGGPRFAMFGLAQRWACCPQPGCSCRRRWTTISCCWRQAAGSPRSCRFSKSVLAAGTGRVVLVYANRMSGQ